MLCPTGELQQDVFYDPRDKVALKFDNFKRVLRRQLLFLPFLTEPHPFLLNRAGV